MIFQLSECSFYGIVPYAHTTPVKVPRTPWWNWTWELCHLLIYCSLGSCHKNHLLMCIQVINTDTFVKSISFEAWSLTSSKMFKQRISRITTRCMNCMNLPGNMMLQLREDSRLVLSVCHLWLHIYRSSWTSSEFPVSRQKGVDDVLGQSHGADCWSTRQLDFPPNALKVKATFSAGCSSSYVYHTWARFH